MSPEAFRLHFRWYWSAGAGLTEMFARRRRLMAPRTRSGHESSAFHGDDGVYCGALPLLVGRAVSHIPEGRCADATDGMVGSVGVLARPLVLSLSRLLPPAR
ncbi:hypothetical protein [Actinoplanes sp. NPDC020271]|uniref:hypothetical protein n=1 Tax=Actinoplanes sp. NPDC020271 TaxID=3363896 RepID=UPI0037B441D1